MNERGNLLFIFALNNQSYLLAKMNVSSLTDVSQMSLSIYYVRL